MHELQTLGGRVRGPGQYLAPEPQFLHLSNGSSGVHVAGRRVVKMGNNINHIYVP